MKKYNTNTKTDLKYIYLKFFFFYSFPSFFSTSVNKKNCVCLSKVLTVKNVDVKTGEMNCSKSLWLIINYFLG